MGQNLQLCRRFWVNSKTLHTYRKRIACYTSLPFERIAIHGLRVAVLQASPHARVYRCICCVALAFVVFRYLWASRYTWVALLCAYRCCLNIATCGHVAIHVGCALLSFGHRRMRMYRCICCASLVFVHRYLCMAAACAYLLVHRCLSIAVVFSHSRF